MNYRCRCGEVHEFLKFETFPTKWGGRTTLFEAYCEDMESIMVLITSTFPPNVFLPLCPGVDKKFIKMASLMPWKEFMSCDWTHAGAIKGAS